MIKFVNVRCTYTRVKPSRQKILFFWSSLMTHDHSLVMLSSVYFKSYPMRRYHQTKFIKFTSPIVKSIFSFDDSWSFSGDFIFCLFQIISNIPLASNRHDNTYFTFCLVYIFLWSLKIITTNARRWARSALSRRKHTSKLLLSYSFIQFQKTDLRFEFLDPDYLWSNFIRKKLFRKKVVFFVKNWSEKKFQKTDFRFGLLTRDNL
jgi:hypothetical protein